MELAGIEPPLYSVQQAIDHCNDLLTVVELKVEGEVSGFSISRGTFAYFSLKDPSGEALLNCFAIVHALGSPLEDGMKVIITGKVKIHAKSGKLSLNVRILELQGEGSLKRAFELLKKKLETEGLFAQDRKRLLPRFPARVGIISSADAAGYGDFRRIARDRLPGIQFVLANVAVQGIQAEGEIVHAFDYLNSHYELDVIVLIRGGGSMEDLQAFNSELVARAIVRSKAPVLVGVGHERDITIADYCADVRAATPSNAAELLLPSKDDVINLVAQLTTIGQRMVERHIERQRGTVERLVQFSNQVLTNAIARSQQRTAVAMQLVHNQLVQQLQRVRERVERTAGTIDAVAPVKTLARGYSITTSGGVVVRSSTQAKAGMPLTTRLHDGTIESTVN